MNVIGLLVYMKTVDTSVYRIRAYEMKKCECFVIHDVSSGK